MSRPVPLYMDVRGSTTFQVFVVLITACLGITVPVHKIWNMKGQAVAALSSSRAQAGIVACTTFVALYVFRSSWTRGAIIAVLAVAWIRQNSLRRFVDKLTDRPCLVPVYSAAQVQAACTPCRISLRCASGCRDETRLAAHRGGGHTWVSKACLLKIGPSKLAI